MEAYARYEEALGELEPPFAFVDLDAMWRNGDDMARRAAGKPLRIASKSVRCREVMRRIHERGAAFSGQLTFTLPETLWLDGEGARDLLLAYPSTDRGALRRLAELAAERAGTGPRQRPPAVMVDSTEHLDLIEAAGASASGPVPVAIDFDLSLWVAGGRVKIGPKRSPLRTPEACAELAREIERRDGVELIGAMGYEGQVAGVGDDRPGGPLRSVENLATRLVQGASMREIARRRAAIVEAIRGVRPDLELVNGGGTGSLERTAAEPAVTELTAGSGFYAPLLFDSYRSFTLRPAAMFCLPVVRRPGPGVATALGGGYLASGAGGKDRLPRPHLPAGLRLDPLEGAGEVQTPLLGRAADGLRVGDRVYFRHVKAGELCERFASLYLLEGGRIVDEVPTYRGEGRCFL